MGLVEGLPAVEGVAVAVAVGGSTLPIWHYEVLLRRQRFRSTAVAAVPVEMVRVRTERGGAGGTGGYGGRVTFVNLAAGTVTESSDPAIAPSSPVVPTSTGGSPGSAGNVFQVNL